MGRNWKEENEDSAKTTFPLGKLSVTEASVTAAPRLHRAPHSSTGCAKCSLTSAVPPVFVITRVTPSRVSLNPAKLAWVRGAVDCLQSRQYLEKGWE